MELPYNIQENAAIGTKHSNFAFYVEMRGR